MKRKERVAVFPGSFDPFTNGHLDIVRRSLEVFDRLIVAVAFNPAKDRSLFTADERVGMIQEAVDDARVTADAFSGLLVDYVLERGGHVIVRGLRAVADFEYEFQMATMNRHLCEDIETFYIMAGESHFYTSSRLVKEVASFGGDVRGLVPKNVHRALRKKLGLPARPAKKAAKR